MSRIRAGAPKRRTEKVVMRTFFLYVGGVKREKRIIERDAIVEAAFLAYQGERDVRIDVYEGSEYRQSMRF